MRCKVFSNCEMLISPETRCRPLLVAKFRMLNKIITVGGKRVKVNDPQFVIKHCHEFQKSESRISFTKYSLINICRLFTLNLSTILLTVFFFKHKVFFTIAIIIAMHYYCNNNYNCNLRFHMQFLNQFHPRKYQPRFCVAVV